LEVGDTFYIRVLNKTLQYEVDQIKVVLPENTNDLRIIQGEDHVTLLTCTPYGINSHRLLVRGKRVPYVENSENSSSGYQSSGDNGFFFMGYKIPYWVAACVVAGFVLVVVIIVIAVLKKRKKQEKPERKTKGNEKE
jgi:sortase A